MVDLPHPRDRDDTWREPKIGSQRRGHLSTYTRKLVYLLYYWIFHFFQRQFYIIAWNIIGWPTTYVDKDWITTKRVCITTWSVRHQKNARLMVLHQSNGYNSIDIIMRCKSGTRSGFNIYLDVSSRLGEINNTISYANSQAIFFISFKHWNTKSYGPCGLWHLWNWNITRCIWRTSCGRAHLPAWNANNYIVV